MVSTQKLPNHPTPSIDHFLRKYNPNSKMWRLPNARFLKKHTTGFSKNHLVTTWSTSLQGFIFHRNFSPVWSKMGHSILEGRFKFHPHSASF